MLNIEHVIDHFEAKGQGNKLKVGEHFVSAAQARQTIAQAIENDRPLDLAVFPWGSGRHEVHVRIGVLMGQRDALPSIPALRRAIARTELLLTEWTPGAVFKCELDEACNNAEVTRKTDEGEGGQRRQGGLFD